ncbi:MAG: ABC transporter ATP-binding protein [Chloroflexi bacterium]|nr:ABC transporter ATP-binding protein [Chloroflexota bacterium]MYD64650.1 ABC transporter ATP-binding protein [Chloroflexota bacterium]
MSPGNDLAIQTQSLRKAYGAVEAVRGVDLAIGHGEVYALLGPNGAGKTTTVEILEGHRERDGGEVSVLGHDPARREPALLRRIGIVLQTPGVEPYLNVAEAIEQYRGFYPHPRPLDEIIEIVGLTEQRGQRIRKLSGGQQRRLDVAIALAGDPELLFLDEPTTGFDPAARRQAWDMVRNLRSSGATVLLTTHYMDEAEHLADRVGVIVDGAMVAEGTPEDLMASSPAAVVSFRLPPDHSHLLDGVEGARASGDGRYEVRTESPTALLHDLTGRALEAGSELAELRVERATLEDVYLDLTSEASS